MNIQNIALAKSLLDEHDRLVIELDNLRQTTLSDMVVHNSDRDRTIFNLSAFDYQALCNVRVTRIEAIKKQLSDL